MPGKVIKDNAWLCYVNLGQHRYIYNIVNLGEFIIFWSKICIHSYCLCGPKGTLDDKLYKWHLRPKFVSWIRFEVYKRILLQSTAQKQFSRADPEKFTELGFCFYDKFS